MAGESYTTVIGNLTNDPELRFTQSGTPVASFSIAVNARRFDRDRNEWVEDAPAFWRCSLWREQAEHACESLHRGDRVVAYGRLRQDSYETAEGEKRTATVIDVEELGASVRFVDVRPQRAARASDEARDPNRAPAHAADSPPAATASR